MVKTKTTVHRFVRALDKKFYVKSHYQCFVNLCYVHLPIEASTVQIKEIILSCNYRKVVSHNYKRVSFTITRFNISNLQQQDSLIM